MEGVRERERERDQENRERRRRRGSRDRNRRRRLVFNFIPSGESQSFDLSTVYGLVGLLIILSHFFQLSSDLFMFIF